MKPRLNPYQAAPEAMKALAALESHVQASGLEPSLIDLVKTRASQINGCAFCIHMHTQGGPRPRRDRGAPLPARRLARIAALQRARAGGAGLDRGGDPDLRDPRPGRGLRAGPPAFAEDELVKLTLLIATINAWNRIAISFRSVHPTKPRAAA